MFSRKNVNDVQEEKENTTNSSEKLNDKYVEVKNTDGDDVEPAVLDILFSKRLTVEEFERSKFMSTAKELRQLLDNLIADKHMKSQDKRRHLNEIKRQYPHIIQSKFGVLSDKAWNHLVKTLAG